MNNINLVLPDSKAANNVFGNKKTTTPANAVKSFYQTLMDDAVKREQETENRKKKRLALIIQKLLAGIILTGDELQFLKNTAPMYFNQAIQQLKNQRAKNTAQHNISEIEPINII